MAILTREQILAAQDIVTEEVEVPEWGGVVLVRGLSAAQMERMQERVKGKGVKGATATLAALALVDSEGKRLFRESDIEALGRKSMAALQRVMSAILRQNALDKTEFEELAKNSGDGQGDDLLSD